MDSTILNALGKDKEISEETDQALTVQDEIYYWILKIKELVTDEHHPVSTFLTKPTPRVYINHPNLHIQPFDGNPLEWLTFWDIYSNAVHNNHKLNNIDKIKYLKESINCNAASAISGLSMTSQNYVKAIEMLKERLGRKQFLINPHMESLPKFSAPAADVRQLQKISRQLRLQHSCLRNMGVQTDSNGSLLIPMLLKKLRRNNYVVQYLEQILGQIVSLMIYEQRFVMK